MIRETMTSEERILAAINLEPYDRVPVSPHINAEYPMIRKGKRTADAYNPELQVEGFQATLDLMEEVGGWDGCTLAGHAQPGYPDSLSFLTGRGALGGYRFPGRSDKIADESSPQYEETVLLNIEDYDEIAALGWRGFLEKTTEEAGATLTRAMKEAGAAATNDRYNSFVGRWNEKGLPVMAGHLMVDPQMALSLLRTLQQFTLDMYRHGDRVVAALDAMVDDMLEDAIQAMNAIGPAPSTGIPGIMMACERGSGQYYNLNLFERFVWPYIKKMCLAWWDAGYVTTLHFDTDWSRNLPYLLELPAKSCIVELDCTTDIFNAKEVLGNHMCIMGDIPPSISSHGTAEDMENYCKKLIDIVGKKTGLILSNGCAVPPDTKTENFQMMMDTPKNYYPHG